MFGCMPFAIKFTAVRSYLSKFILISVLTGSSLGFFESVRVTNGNTPAKGQGLLEHVLRLDIRTDIGAESSDSRSAGPEADDDFSFEFPNIFYVFRSIF
jgi:hypothetical protein